MFYKKKKHTTFVIILNPIGIQGKKEATKILTCMGKMEGEREGEEREIGGGGREKRFFFLLFLL